MPPREPTVVDLFSGVGGFSLGLQAAGYSVEVAVDSDETILGTYQNNFPDTVTKCLDLSEVESDRILEDTGLKKSDVDVVVGGPPCQGFSVIGNREEDDERNDLLPTYADHLVNLEPDYFVLENVDGLLSGHARDYLNDFLETVKDHGYSVKEPIEVLNAVDYGVPQNRKRLFVLGYKSDLPEPKYPEETENKVAVEEAFQDLPSYLDDVEIVDGTLTGTRCKASDYVREINSWEDEAGRSIENLTSFDPVDHEQRIRDRYDEVKPGSYDEVSNYYRLDPSKPSSTLRAGSSKSRGTHTAARPIHPVAPRVITVREAARLQSFPDWFQFHHTKYYSLREIGNSVPPLISKQIGERLIQ